MTHGTNAPDFHGRIEPFRRELCALCYRMTGSLHDAEDLTQETLLRAWNQRHGFEGRSSLRTWLHRIAVNACLDALDKRRPRSLPTEQGPAARPEDGPGAPAEEALWLTPAPDALFEGTEPGPEARYGQREGVALALLVALQLLPPRQRAVLILRDVLGWSAAETAEALEMPVPAANSALQRARETLSSRGRSEEPMMLAPDDVETRKLLERYVHAWEQGDPAALVGLLHEEVTLAMPPMPAWYRGRESVGGVLSGLLAGEARGRFRLRPVSANGRPAVAIYQRGEASGAYAPLGLQLLDTAAGRVQGMVTFLDPSLFQRFGLPSLLQ